MRKTEQKFWDRLRPRLDGAGILHERIENMVATGTADINTVWEGIETWVELKAIPEFPEFPQHVVLGRAKGPSIDQRNWHITRAKHGSRTVIAVAAGPKHIYTVSGKLADDIHKFNIRDFEEQSIAIGYDGLIDYLKGHW